MNTGKVAVSTAQQVLGSTPPCTGYYTSVPESSGLLSPLPARIIHRFSPKVSIYDLSVPVFPYT